MLTHSATWKVQLPITPLGVERQAAGAREMERVQKELGSALSGIDLPALERLMTKLS